MICNICGKTTPKHAAFCSYCGAAIATASLSAAPASSATEVTVAAKKDKSTAAFIFAGISVLLAAALVLSFLGISPSPFGVPAASSAEAVAAQGFDTPEDAVESFVSYLKAGDYSGILSTCAIDNIAQGFDYKVFSERLGGLFPIPRAYLPTEYPDYVLYNKVKLTQEMLSKIYCVAVSFHLSVDYIGITGGGTHSLKADAFPDSIIKEMEPVSLDELNIVDIKKVVIDEVDLDMKNRKEQAGMFGGDDIQCRTVLYEYEGDYYVGGFTLIEYNGIWLVKDLIDSYSGAGADPGLKLDSKSQFYDFFEN